MYYNLCEGEEEKSLLIGNKVLFFKKAEEIPKEIENLIEKEGQPLPEWKFGELDLVFFEITNKCNYDCIHCYNMPYRKEGITISVDEFKKAIDKLSSQYYKIHLIQITGGEPFTVKNLEEYVEIAAEKAEEVQIFSNGSLINNLDKLEKFKKKLTLRVSFYSLDKNNYLKITKKGLYNKTLNNILELKKRGFNVQVEIPIIPGINEEDYDTTKKYFNARGIPTKSSYIIGYGNAVNLERKRSKSISLPNNVVRRWRISKNYDNCWATHLAINPKGEVFPCIFAREYKIGNILEEEAKSIKERHEKLSSKYKADNLSECKSCELRYVCKSCLPRAKSFGLEGVMQAHCPKYNEQEIINHK